MPDTPASRTSLVIGVTGHRKLRDADSAALKAQVMAFFGALQARYPGMPLVVLSPLAEGADGLVADVAFDLGLRVIAPLPMPVEMYRKDFATPESLAQFDRRLARAEPIILPMRSSNVSGSPDAVGAARDLQYAEAGFFVSRHCHVLLALWDGGEQASMGGTSHVVDFHLSGELPSQMERRAAATRLLGLADHALVWHIPAAREASDAPHPMPPRWLTTNPDGSCSSSHAMPDAFDQMFRRQAEFNDDLARYADRVAGECGGELDERHRCPVHRRFVAVDWMARTYQKRVTWVLRATYVIAAATGSAFILYAHVHSQDAMIYLYLLLFAAGLGLAVLVKRRQWHRKYLDYRALAEALRVQSFWRRASVHDIRRPMFSNDDFVSEQDLELGWIRNVMREASIEGLLAPLDPSPEQVDAVIDEWIGTPESNGQLRYFAATADKRARHHQSAERWARTSLIVGISISIVLAVFAHHWGHDLKNVLVVLMGLLSVGAGVHEAYAHKKADKELVKQYRFMHQIYAGARRRLDYARSLEDKRKILRVLGEAALGEHVEWTLMHRERPLEHTRLGG